VVDQTFATDATNDMPQRRSPAPGIRFTRVTSALSAARSRSVGVRGGVDAPVSINRTAVLDAQSRTVRRGCASRRNSEAVTPWPRARDLRHLTGYGDSISMQCSRASAGHGRRGLRLLPGSFSPSHVGGCACSRRMSAQGGVQRSVPRRDSGARTGDDLPALSGWKNSLSSQPTGDRKGRPADV
jgi:hypothetical protein